MARCLAPVAAVDVVLERRPAGRPHAEEDPDVDGVDTLGRD